MNDFDGADLETLNRHLSEQFQIEGLVARGGMGVVYVATERSLGRSVALKVFPLGSQTSPGARERFRREARMVAQLSHPGIVPLFAYGETEDFLYFTMALVQGESLEAKLEREGYLGSEEVTRIMRDVLGALGHAHGRGLVHRDIKPANILLEHGTRRVLLADFGIAHAVGGPLPAARTVAAAPMGDPHEPPSRTKELIGTPLYMAPEQWSGGPVDGRADLYSLGLAMYEAVTGVHPHTGMTSERVLESHVRPNIQTLHSLRPDVDPRLEEAIRLCIDPSPQRRPPSVGAVLALLGGSQVPAIPEHRPVLPELRAAIRRWPLRFTVVPFAGGWLVAELLTHFAHQGLLAGSASIVGAAVWVGATAVGLGWTVKKSRERRSEGTAHPPWRSAQPGA